MWYIFLLVYGSIDPMYSTSAYKVFVEILAPAPLYWLLTLLIPVTCILPYAVYETMRRKYWPMDHQLIQEIHYLRKHIQDSKGYADEQAKAVRKTSIGFTSHAIARKKAAMKFMPCKIIAHTTAR